MKSPPPLLAIKFHDNDFYIVWKIVGRCILEGYYGSYAALSTVEQWLPVLNSLAAPIYYAHQHSVHNPDYEVPSLYGYCSKYPHLKLRASDVAVGEDAMAWREGWAQGTFQPSVLVLVDFEAGTCEIYTS